MKIAPVGVCLLAAGGVIVIANRIEKRTLAA